MVWWGRTDIRRYGRGAVFVRGMDVCVVMTVFNTK